MSKHLKTILVYLYIFGVFALPLSLEAKIPGTDSQILYVIEPLCILAIFGLTIYVLITQTKKWTLRFNLTDKLIVAHFIALFIATIYSDDLFVSMKYFVTLTWYLCFGYVIPRMISFSRKEFKQAILAHLAGVALLSIYTLVQWSRMGIFYESSYHVAKPFLEIGHTNLSVLIELPLFILAGVFLLTQNSLKRNAVVAILFTIYLAVIIFSCSKASYFTVLVCFIFFLFGILKIKGSKTIYYTVGILGVLGILGLMIVKGYLIRILNLIHFQEYQLIYVIATLAAYVFYLFRNRRKKHGKILMYISLPLVLLISVWYANDFIHETKYKDQKRSYYSGGDAYYNSKDRSTYKPTSIIAELAGAGEVESNNSNLERRNRWKVGIKMMLDKPMAGVGLGTFADKYLETKRNSGVDVNYLTKIRMNIHNMYLGWLVEGGVYTFVTGACLFMLIVAGFGIYFSSQKNAHIKLVLFMFFLSFALHAFAHDFNQDARVIIPFWGALAVLSRMLESTNKKKRTIIKV